MTEPLLSANQARVVLAQLKGCKKINHGTLTSLVLKQGLRKHDDPFGSGRWCFLESEIESWFQSKLAVCPKPLRGPGRPAKHL